MNDLNRRGLILGVGTILFGLVGFAQVEAQEPVQLSLEDAIELALRQNPTVLQARNDEVAADWAVRSAYASLLPTADVSLGGSWQAAGEGRVGNLTLGDLGVGAQPAYLNSNYNLGLSYRLDWATLLGPKQSKADREVTRAQIGEVSWTTRTEVTNGYVEVLRQQAALGAARRQLEGNQINLRLAQAQLEVGTGTSIDVGTAEVQVGRSEVSVLRAENALETGYTRLRQRLGLPLSGETGLTTAFEPVEPRWRMDELLPLALDQNPGLSSVRNSRSAAEVRVSSSRSSYLPSLSISTGWSGHARSATSTDPLIAQAQAGAMDAMARCESTNDLHSRLVTPIPATDCSQFAFTDAMRQGIIDGNEEFPFSFQSSPASVSFSVSVPVFQGLSRQRSLAAAKTDLADLRYQVADQERAVEADLQINLSSVETAFTSASLEERNLEVAEEQLRLARQRYALGSITFVELVQAQTDRAQAEADHLSAVFAYHDAVTALEAVVGAPLRSGSN